MNVILKITAPGTEFGRPHIDPKVAHLLGFPVKGIFSQLQHLGREA
jgi:hypothetical protein